MSYLWKIDDGSKIKLSDYNPGDTFGHNDKTVAEAELQELSHELSKLQELMAAAQHHSMLIILQGMDTSGKDGTIRHVLANVNPLAATSWLLRSQPRRSCCMISCGAFTRRHRRGD